MKVYFKIVLVLWLFLLVKVGYGQENSFRYSGQFFRYGQHDMNGIRQTLSYHHHITNGFSVAFNLFSGTGRGSDISSDFKKDYVLLSLNNWQNVHPNLTTGFNSFTEGIYNYKRISEGLIQDQGWGLSLFYKVFSAKKLTIDVGFGYQKYETKSIIRISVMEISITNTQSGGDLENYMITYPAPLISNYNDGAFAFNTHFAYQINQNISLGASVTFNRSPYTLANDLGTGLIFKYML